MSGTIWRITATGVLLALAAPLSGAILQVRPGRNNDYQRIADACEAAEPGDTIVVFPGRGRSREPYYQQVALLIKTPRLTIQGVGGQVRLDGSGFRYSGIGSTPRAIIQINPTADGCRISGFELTGAHNQSHNGAGIRINQANNVTISNCEIHDNDMGIMSNGKYQEKSGAGQRIERCDIHDNGNREDPGYNHNLYLGGTSASVVACEISESITGHNLKSRAHCNWIAYCYIHDSANRELDLVDDKNVTDVPGSDTVLLGNIIIKKRPTRGNHAVMQFGQDGGHDHSGTLYLIHNTIVTPYGTSVVQLTAPGAKLQMHNNIVWGAGVEDHGRKLVSFGDGAEAAGCAITHNWLALGYSRPDGDKLVWKGNVIADEAGVALFVNPQAGNFHLRVGTGPVDLGIPLEELNLPYRPVQKGTDDVRGPLNLKVYDPPRRTKSRPIIARPDAGAYEFAL